MQNYIQEHYQTIVERLGERKHQLGRRLEVHADSSIVIQLADGDTLRIRRKDLVRRKHERESAARKSKKQSQSATTSANEKKQQKPDKSTSTSSSIDVVVLSSPVASPCAVSDDNIAENHNNDKTKDLSIVEPSSSKVLTSHENEHNRKKASLQQPLTTPLASTHSLTLAASPINLISSSPKKTIIQNPFSSELQQDTFAGLDAASLIHGEPSSPTNNGKNEHDAVKGCGNDPTLVSSVVPPLITSGESSTASQSRLSDYTETEKEKSYRTVVDGENNNDSDVHVQAPEENLTTVSLTALPANSNHPPMDDISWEPFSNLDATPTGRKDAVSGEKHSGSDEHAVVDTSRSTDSLLARGKGGTQATSKNLNLAIANIPFL